MREIKPNDDEAKSADLVMENIQSLKALFPEFVTEGPGGFSVNVDVLKELMGDQTVTDCEEKYGLNWFGKRKARQLALTPSTGTLRPCPDESVCWETTQNLMIEGDNLEVLKLLQKSYGGRVKAIYIDPPYNTGKNLLYPNDYSDGISAYLEVTGQIEGGAKLTSNPETSGRFHSNWLSMIFSRLKLAKNLLRHDGVLFCTIDENEYANLALVLKELFGEGAYEHAYVTIVHNPRGQQGTNISYVHEYAIIVYPADKKKYLADVPKNEIDARNLRDSGTESDRTDALNCFYPFVVKDGRIIEVGDVPPNDFHPSSANITRQDGSVEVWPMTDSGDEKKWRYAKSSVQSILNKLEPKLGRESIQIIFNKDSGTMRSVWQNARYDASEYGTKLLEDLIPGTGFTFPKSLWAVYDALKLMTKDDPDAIVLDFFAGSGTTAQAIMELNKEDNGTRKFILVQLPEPLDLTNTDQKIAVEFCDQLHKPRNIAELTKERLRRAAKKIKEDNPDYQGDLGFRVFKLDSSNIQVWEPNPPNIQEAIQNHIENLKPDRSERDILFEVLLKLGLPLTVPIEEKSIAGKVVYSVGSGALFVCLAEKIENADVEPLSMGIVQWKRELLPEVEVQVVFRDSAFSSDVAKTNLTSILEQNGFARNNVRSL